MFATQGHVCCGFVLGSIQVMANTSSAFQVTAPEPHKLGTTSAAARLLAQGVKGLGPGTGQQTASPHGLDASTFATSTPPRRGAALTNTVSPGAHAATLLQGLKPFLASPSPPSDSPGSYAARVPVAQQGVSWGHGQVAHVHNTTGSYSATGQLQQQPAYAGQSALPTLVPPPGMHQHSLLGTGALPTQHPQASSLHMQAGHSSSAYTSRASAAQWSAAAASSYSGASQPRLPHSSPGRRYSGHGHGHGRGMGGYRAEQGHAQGKGQGQGLSPGTPGSQRSAGHKRDRAEYSHGGADDHGGGGRSRNTNAHASSQRPGMTMLQYVSRHPVMPVAAAVHRPAADIRLRYPRLSLPVHCTAVVCCWRHTSLPGIEGGGWPEWLLQGDESTHSYSTAVGVDVVIDNDRKSTPHASSTSTAHTREDAARTDVPSVCSYVDPETKQEHRARFTVKLLLCLGPVSTSLAYDASKVALDAGKDSTAHLHTSAGGQNGARGPSKAEGQAPTDGVGLGRYLPSEVRLVTSRTQDADLVLPGGPYVHSLDGGVDGGHGSDPWTDEAPLLTAARRHCARDLGLDLSSLTDSAFVKLLTIHFEPGEAADAATTSINGDVRGDAGVRDVTVVYAVTGWLAHCSALQRQAAMPPGLAHADHDASSTDIPAVTLYGRPGVETASQSVRHRLITLDGLLDYGLQDTGKANAEACLAAEALLEIVQCCSASLLQRCVESVHALSVAGILTHQPARATSPSGSQQEKRVRGGSTDSSSTSTSASRSASTGSESVTGSATPDRADVGTGVDSMETAPGAPDQEGQPERRERSDSIDSLFEAPPAVGDAGPGTAGRDVLVCSSWLRAHLWHCIAAFRLLDKEGTGFVEAAHLQLLFLNALPSACSILRASSLLRRAQDVLCVINGPCGVVGRTSSTGVARVALQAHMEALPYASLVNLCQLLSPA